MNIEEIRSIVKACSYKPGWEIRVQTELIDNTQGNFIEGRSFIQLSVTTESDATLDSQKRDGTRVPWKSGKRYLSEFMCKQEIVGVVFALIKDAEMHEVHEWFRYKNASIYNPHLDPDVLASVARKKSSFNTRENAMTMDEPKP